jgi:predicted Zn-dependent protease
MLNKAIWLLKGQNKKEEALKLLNEVKGQISSENPFYNQLTQLYNRISSEN